VRRLVFLGILILSQTTFAFTLVRANLKGWAARPLTISYNPANCPSDMAELVEKAAAIWNSVLDSSLRIEINANSSCSPSTIWSGNCSDAFALACDTNFSGTTSVSAMGVATVTMDGDRKIDRGMVLYNVEGGGGLLQASAHFRLVVVTHEIGHALGLGHSDDSEAIMRSGGNTGGHARLSPDDQQGVRYLYPGNELDQNQLLGCGRVSAFFNKPPPPPPPPWTGLLMLLPLALMVYLRRRPTQS
jgi:hypothetical protein